MTQGPYDYQDELRRGAEQVGAHRAIKETELIRLALEDQRAFAEAILNPSEPAPALRRAARNHHELIRESQ